MKNIESPRSGRQPKTRRRRSIYWLMLRVGSPRYRSGFCNAIARFAGSIIHLAAWYLGLTPRLYAVVRSAHRFFEAFAPEERNICSSAQSFERRSPLGSGNATSERRKDFRAVTRYKHLVPTGRKEVYRAGWFRISASAFNRFASAALFALVASFSNAGAISFRFPVSPF